MDNATTTKIILAINAVLLVIGTIVQGMETPVRSTVLSCLFVVWMATLVWRVMSAQTPESAKSVEKF